VVTSILSLQFIQHLGFLGDFPGWQLARASMPMGLWSAHVISKGYFFSGDVVAAIADGNRRTSSRKKAEYLVIGVLSTKFSATRRCFRFSKAGRSSVNYNSLYLLRPFS
jgi:hypothetical protein